MCQTPVHDCLGEIIHLNQSFILENIMNFKEHLANLKATLEKKRAEQKEIAEKAVEQSRNMDAAESEQFETLGADIKSLQADIKRFSELVAADAETATPVSDAENREKSVTPGAVPVGVKNTEKLEKGIAFARAAKCLALGAMAQRDPMQVAKSMYHDREDIVACVNQMATKATVPAATTTDPAWAGALVSPAGVFADFVEFLRPSTIIGRFGQGNIPAYRRVPFRVPFAAQDSAGSAYWTAEGGAKGLTSLAFSQKTLEPLKVATIAVATMETLRDASADVDYLIRDGIANAVRERLDRDFIDPTKAAVPGVSPASILNGATNIASTGTNADAVRADINALIRTFAAANNRLSTGVLIMSSDAAIALASMYTLANQEFPGMTINGGTLMGIPVIVSDYVPNDATAGSVVALVQASDIYVADAGDVDISISREATLHMSDAPSTDLNGQSPVVNLWQNNMVGFRAERTINWALRRPSSAAYLTGVKWGR